MYQSSRESDFYTYRSSSGSSKKKKNKDKYSEGPVPNNFGFTTVSRSSYHPQEQYSEPYASGSSHYSNGYTPTSSAPRYDTAGRGTMYYTVGRAKGEAYSNQPSKKQQKALDGLVFNRFSKRDGESGWQNAETSAESPYYVDDTYSYNQGYSMNTPRHEPVSHAPMSPNSYRSHNGSQLTIQEEEEYPPADYDDNDDDVTYSSRPAPKTSSRPWEENVKSKPKTPAGLSSFKMMDIPQNKTLRPVAPTKSRPTIPGTSRPPSHTISVTHGSRIQMQMQNEQKPRHRHANNAGSARGLPPPPPPPPPTSFNSGGGLPPVGNDRSALMAQIRQGAMLKPTGQKGYSATLPTRRSRR